VNQEGLRRIVKMTKGCIVGMDDREKEEDSDSHFIIGSWGVIVRETVNVRLTLKDLLQSSNIIISEYIKIHGLVATELW
jgi:hypothetical protein